MVDFSGLDARSALIQFYARNADTFPELGEAAIKTDFLGSVIEGVETLYTYRERLDEEGASLLYDLARFVSANNFYGKGVRAGLIAGIAHRIVSGGDAELEGDVESEGGVRTENTQI